MYPRADPRSETPQTAVPTRIAGRCGMSGGAARPPLFIPHLFLLPIRPSSRRLGVLPALAAHAAHRPQQGDSGGREGQGRHLAGKPPQTAAQGQTAGNGQGGPLGPPAVCSHRHFRPMVLLQFSGRRGHLLRHPLGAVLLQRQAGLLAVVLHLPEEGGLFHGV